MENKEIFGYKYDKNNDKLIIDEEQAEVVKAIFDLAATYSLENDEIYYLCTKKKTIQDIISSRLYSIYDKLKEYGFYINNPLTKIDLSKFLSSNNIEEIINPLLSIKKKIENNEDMQFILSKIDKVINLINQQNHIIKQYGDFEKVSSVINEYNIRKRDILYGKV